jgi:hypothetical protein
MLLSEKCFAKRNSFPYKFIFLGKNVCRSSFLSILSPVSILAAATPQPSTSAITFYIRQTPFSKSKAKKTEHWLAKRREMTFNNENDKQEKKGKRLLRYKTFSEYQ